jgi:hypothetical protein
MCCMLFCSSAADGLPFRTRGNKQQAEEEAATTAEAVLYPSQSSGDKESIIIIPPKRVHRNAIVETYYEASDVAHKEASEALVREIRQQAHNLTDFLVSTRRTLHQIPELMYQEKETSAIVQHVLNQLGESSNGA